MNCTFLKLTTKRIKTELMMMIFILESLAVTHTDLILRAHTHTPWSLSLKMCSCLGRLLQPQQHRSESWALPTRMTGPRQKKRRSEIAQKLKPHSPVYKDTTTGWPSRRLAVHLPDGKTADHGADHTANFHHQRLPTTRYKVWRMKKMRQNFNFDFGIHFCVFAPWAAPPWESWLHWGNI